MEDVKIRHVAALVLDELYTAASVRLDRRRRTAEGINESTDRQEEDMSAMASLALHHHSCPPMPILSLISASPRDLLCATDGTGGDGGGGGRLRDPGLGGGGRGGGGDLLPFIVPGGGGLKTGMAAERNVVHEPKAAGATTGQEKNAFRLGLGTWLFDWM